MYLHPPSSPHLGFCPLHKHHTPQSQSEHRTCLLTRILPQLLLPQVGIQTPSRGLQGSMSCLLVLCALTSRLAHLCFAPATLKVSLQISQQNLIFLLSLLLHTASSLPKSMFPLAYCRLLVTALPRRSKRDSLHFQQTSHGCCALNAEKHY